MFEAFSLLFQTGVWIKNTCYNTGLCKSIRVPVPVVSVGGIEAGGTGKTQAVQYLVHAFTQQGLRVGLLTRGYKRTSRGLVVHTPGHVAQPACLGDEPAMLVQAGYDIPIAACADRVQGAHALLKQGCNLLLLDDGFSHRRIHRDLDIVVVRDHLPFGNGWFLPKGPLREPPSSLQRAHVVWSHHRTSSPSAHTPLNIPGVVHVRSHQTPLIFHPPCQGPALAVAGVAHPKDFFTSLQQQGVQVVHTQTFADHHVYTPQDVHCLQRLCEQKGASYVVTTAKDAVKLKLLWSGPVLSTASTHMVVSEGQLALEGVLKNLTAAH
jgi:tetraacyldisaccharide 4'-kinase